MGFDQVRQAVNCLFRGYAFLDALFAYEEVYLARRAAHIAEVGIRKRPEGTRQPIDYASIKQQNRPPQPGVLCAFAVTAGAD